MSRNSEVVSLKRAERTEKSVLVHHETEWLTAKEAAAHLRVKARTLLLWTRQGRINGYALSGGKRHAWRYLREDLDAALLGKTRAMLGSPSVLVTEGEQ
jgi:excisionase family DNA binding protein